MSQKNKTSFTLIENNPRIEKIIDKTPWLKQFIVTRKDSEKDNTLHKQKTDHLQ